MPELRSVHGVVHGVGVRGNLPAAFGDHLWPATATPDAGAPKRTLEMRYRAAAKISEAPFTWESEPGTVATPGRFTLAATGEGFRLDAWGEERGRFEARGRRLDITWQGDPGSAAHHAFAYALPVWLESRGVPVLHGAAVTLEGRGVAFLAPSGTGKSVLCTQLVQRGAGFLADDGLALEGGGDDEGGNGTWRCHPGPPLLRLWPSGLTGHLGLPADRFPRFRPAGDKRHLPWSDLAEGSAPHGAESRGTPGATEAPAAARLYRLYLLQRRPEAGGAVETAPLRPREALLRLVEHGVAAGPVAALGLEAARLERLARLAESVPARALTIPSGEDAIDRVLERLAEDLAQT